MDHFQIFHVVFSSNEKICHLLQLKKDCRLLVELGCHPCLQIKHRKAVTTVISGEISLDNKMFFFSEGKTMQHSPFICTTWKGSMAQLPLVLVYHIPLQIATVWGVLRHLTSRWYNSYRLDVQLPFFSDAFYHIFFVG